MRNGFGRLAFGAVLFGTFLGGCRFKGGESFLAETTPNTALGGAEWRGDEYTNAGIAEASGGIHAQTRYGEGARLDAPGKLESGYDQPAKGSGQQPGEFNNEASSGFGNSNGPGLQPSPSEVNSLSARRGQ